MKTIPQILAQAPAFLDNVFAALGMDNIDVSEFQLDHICYRVETVARYNKLKIEFAKIASLLSEEMISNRPIATYKLHEPMQYEGREISCFELPSPKASSPHEEGYEHVEFVIPVTFAKFQAMYPHVTFSQKALHKKINPDISLSYEGFSVKFHRDTLENVIKFEQSQ